MTARIPKYLKNILNTGEGSDFSIVVSDEEGSKTERKVHKVVIRQCPYFAAMLDLKGTEANNGSVTIENITKDIFDYVLRYLYTDELDDMTMEQAVKVAVAADYLQLDDLKSISLNIWKDYFMSIEKPEDVLEAFRTLIASSLRVLLDESWRNALESLLIAMYDPATNFNIVEESDSFIEFFIDYFGRSHPCLSAHTLAKWTLAGDLTYERQSERKTRAAGLLKKIDLVSLTLQTLAILSKTGAFPALYMLNKIQQRAVLRDMPASDKVEYSISMKVGRIVELEFEADYALFQFMNVDTESVDKKITLWKFLHIPNNCETLVMLNRPHGPSAYWPNKASRGRMPPPLRLKDFKCELGAFNFKITLKGGDTDTPHYAYEIVFD